MVATRGRQRNVLPPSPSAAASGGAGPEPVEGPLPPSTNTATAARSMALGFVLSGINLALATALLTLLQGWGDWSFVRFLGLFGCTQLVAGLALASLERTWQLPAEAWATGTPSRLVLPTALKPGWLRASPAVAGVPCLAFAAAVEGVACETLLLAPLLVGWYLAVAGLSLALAAWGCAHPRLDLFQVVLRRPGRRDFVAPPLSAGALAVQVVLNLAVFPLVASLHPTVLYRPDLAPSTPFAGASLGIGLTMMCLGLVAWRARITRG